MIANAATSTVGSRVAAGLTIDCGWIMRSDALCSRSLAAPGNGGLRRRSAGSLLARRVGVLAGDRVALVEPCAEIDHAAALRAERAVRVAFPRGLVAALRAEHTARHASRSYHPACAAQQRI